MDLIFAWKVAKFVQIPNCHWSMQPAPRRLGIRARPDEKAGHSLASPQSQAEQRRLAGSRRGHGLRFAFFPFRRRWIDNAAANWASTL